MIKTNNRTWRTLEQPLYVNGKKVLEVWANDTLVYPENSAEFIKVRGKVSFNETYGEDAQHIPENGYSHPAYSGVFSGTAEFAACFIRMHTGNNHFILTDKHSEPMTSGPDWISYTGTMPHGGNNNCICVPKDKNRKTIGLEQTVYNSGNMPSHWVSDKIIYRQNISSFPLRPEEWGSAYGYSWTAKLVNPYCTEITYLNGTHKTEEGEAASISQNTLSFEKTINNITFRMSLRYSKGHGAYLDLYIPSFIRKNGVLFTDVTHNGVPVPDWTEDIEMVYSNVRPLFCIPVTDIMYFGGYYAAPEEMLDVTAADLDF